MSSSYSDYFHYYYYYYYLVDFGEHIRHYILPFSFFSYYLFFLEYFLSLFFCCLHFETTRKICALIFPHCYLEKKKVKKMNESKNLKKILGLFFKKKKRKKCS
ncbi:hypothetical protein, unlikely [Trypanosoma brucei gambiense DAL972]|uniref:Uncharacterized protein n=1 Tax=Trypanosoma brucei gambiense (strain MHOM/CI/86/DAL972) TaxID=679716 RepID=D0A988_TRYB9|nr:hypothetical protein, unlikely [Trypanosoma brucei gambiense DAL972]CBH18239.1 hypothetical protein, unlikely [Trypanosoma brucei gambiense DAL972]|eukprot:XP_011780503.1 hypothetical protein, unlikely [Trypanosoma brucei gambiense DAL972]